jgi:hypothetical protein
MFLDISIELLRAGYSVRFRPSGHSMRPTILDGEVVTVAPISAHAIRRSDILLYQIKGRVIAHRVTGIKKRQDAGYSFILRGDALACAERVEEEQVLGRVVAVERDGRRLSLTSQRAKLLHAARAGALQLRARVFAMRKPQSEVNG